MVPRVRRRTLEPRTGADTARVPRTVSCQSAIGARSILKAGAVSGFITPVRGAVPNITVVHGAVTITAIVAGIVSDGYALTLIGRVKRLSRSATGANDTSVGPKSTAVGFS